MALHPGEAGYEEQFDSKRKMYEEKRCTVEKNVAEEAPWKIACRQANGSVASGMFGNLVPPVSLTSTEIQKHYKSSETQTAEFDKNNPGSLKQLRWAIYELIDKFDGDYGKTVAGCLKMKVEELFQKYTNS